MAERRDEGRGEDEKGGVVGKVESELRQPDSAPQRWEKQGKPGM